MTRRSGAAKALVEHPRALPVTGTRVQPAVQMSPVIQERPAGGLLRYIVLASAGGSPGRRL
jgi:hypothetical protein